MRILGLQFTSTTTKDDFEFIIISGSNKQLWIPLPATAPEKNLKRGGGGH